MSKAKFTPQAQAIVDGKAQMPAIDKGTVKAAVSVVATALGLPTSKPVVVETANGTKYTALAANAITPKVDGNDAPITNKRAFTVALYLAVCEQLGCKPATNNPQALRIVAHVLPHCGLGYSKQKQHALKGGEVSDAGGMRGYATFITKPAAASLLPNGERHAVTGNYSKLAKAMLTLHGGTHLAAAKATVPTASK